MRCAECQKGFVPSRVDQRFCCAKCRVKNVEKNRGPRDRADYQARYYAAKKEAHK
jgi:hypothetical protein